MSLVLCVHSRCRSEMKTFYRLTTPLNLRAACAYFRNGVVLDVSVLTPFSFLLTPVPLMPVLTTLLFLGFHVSAFRSFLHGYVASSSLRHATLAMPSFCRTRFHVVLSAGCLGRLNCHSVQTSCPRVRQVGVSALSSFSHLLWLSVNRWYLFRWPPQMYLTVLAPLRHGRALRCVPSRPVAHHTHVSPAIRSATLFMRNIHFNKRSLSRF